MMVDQLVARYERGAIIAEELFVRLLLAVDPVAPGLILDAIPADLRARLGTFVRDYRIGQMTSSCGGALPADEQIIAARAWLTRPTAPTNEYPINSAASTQAS